MKRWTVLGMLSEGPCAKYNYAEVSSLWDGRESLSLLDIVELPIPIRDRIWCVFRPEALTRDQTIRLLDRIVSRAVRDIALDCPGLEAWAKYWLSGRDRSIRSAFVAAIGLYPLAEANVTDAACHYARSLESWDVESGFRSEVLAATYAHSAAKAVTRAYYTLDTVKGEHELVKQINDLREVLEN